MAIGSPLSSPTIRASLDYFEVWKHFQKRGAEAKESMVKVQTWILGFASALLAYLVDKTMAVGGPLGFQVTQPLTALILALSGLALARFAWVTMKDFGSHIDGQFDSADRALRELVLLQPLLGIDPHVGPGPYKGARLSHRLGVLIIFFAIIFGLAAATSIVSLVSSGAMPR